MTWPQLCSKKATVDDIQLEKKESGQGNQMDDIFILTQAVSSWRPGTL